VIAPATQKGERPRTLQQGCSKNLAKGGYRGRPLGFRLRSTSNEIGR
jgi:hypothetical protein